MTEQTPPAGFRRHRFLEQSIDLPASLNEAQIDGRACIRCGHEAEPGEAMRPVEAWSEQKRATLRMRRRRGLREPTGGTS